MGKKRYKHTTAHTLSKGSFLLELLVAFAIISIALTVVVDSFISSQKSYRIIADQTYLTQTLSTVLEEITKESRVSNGYGCGLATPSPCNSTNTFSMTHIVGLNGQVAGENIVYTLSAGGEIQKNSLQMTSNTKVVVTEFAVKVFGTHGSDQVQALVTITAHTVNSPIEVHLQTSFSERTY